MTVAVRVLLLLSFITIVFSCKKESFTSDPGAQLTTSVDSLHFDTVFTTTGSTSQFIKIFNDNTKGVTVSSVRLAGGASSPFKINVDGLPGPQVSDIEIAPKDSAYIYVTVSINPNSSPLPFVVQDSIEITWNGNKTWVQLDAYGRNAHFLRNKKVTGSEVWNDDLPYVILGQLVVDTTATLTINKGVKVHMHADAPFIVHGTLQVNGEADDSTRVLFTGDRLDDPYRDFPASYPGIIFTSSSRNNVLTYAIVKNAYQAIVAVDPSSTPKVTLNETIIDNAYESGIFAINSNISARNVLVSNCGQNLQLLYGGTYSFTHCTIASYSNAYLQHKKPVAFIADFIKQGNVVYTNPLNATFRNCILWGESGGFVTEEVQVGKQGTAPLNVSFQNVLWRTPNALASGLVSGNEIKNQSPLFDTVNVSERIFNFRLKDSSPALNKGANTGVSIDLDGKPRPVGLPDLGAYERQ